MLDNLSKLNNFLSIRDKNAKVNAFAKLQELVYEDERDIAILLTQFDEFLEQMNDLLKIEVDINIVVRLDISKMGRENVKLVLSNSRIKILHYCGQKVEEVTLENSCQLKHVIKSLDALLIKLEEELIERKKERWATLQRLKNTLNKVEHLNDF